MKTIYSLLIILGLMILQSTALGFVAVGGVRPDLVMVFVILNGFLRGTREGAFLGFVGGILQDLVSGGYFGMYALTNMTAGYLGGLGEGRLYKDNRVIASGLALVCTAGALLVHYALLLTVEVRVAPLDALTGVIIPVALYNALVVVLFYGYYYRSYQRELLNDHLY